LNKIFWLVFFFILGGAGVLFILPSFTLRLLFILIILAVLAWTLRAGRKIEINILALITAYVLSTAQFGLHFFFRIPAWALLVVTFIWVTVLFWLGFRLKIGNITTSAKLLSLVTGLAGAEIALALLFWPTHFLVTSTVFFLLFYLVWMMANFYMLGILSRNRLLIHSVFVVLVLSVLLFTAQWTI